MQWALLVISLLAWGAACSTTTLAAAASLPHSAAQLNSYNQWSKARDPYGLWSQLLQTTASHGDISLKTLVKLLVALESESQEEENHRYDSKRSSEMKKRSNTFWQPMGGPLPVQTRFVSFGNRLEPDRTSQQDGPSGIKAMRYGRR